jgi:hypothetical protein
MLDMATIKTVYQSGFSRIPVWHKDEHDIVGVFLVKDLVMIDPKEGNVPLLDFVQVFGKQGCAPRVGRRHAGRRAQGLQRRQHPYGACLRRQQQRTGTLCSSLADSSEAQHPLVYRATRITSSRDS